MIKYKEEILGLIEQGYINKVNHDFLPIFILNYTPKCQYERYWNDLTLQCRGLVLEEDTYKVIAKPFNKFFNLEETLVENIPNEEFEVTEKLDGSLGIGFFYNKEFIICTRGSFNSEQAIKAKEICKKYEVSILSLDFTYLFEIIYPENRIVLNYEFEELIVLSIVNNSTLIELSYDNLESNTLEKLGFKLVKRYNGIQDYTRLKSLIKDDEEGFVIKFKSGIRLKIKGEEYLRLHRILTRVSNKTILEYLEEGRDINILLEKVPDEFNEFVKKVINQINTRFLELENYSINEYHRIIEELPMEFTRKDFALKALNTKYPSLLFNNLSNKSNSKYIYSIIKEEMKYSQPFKNNEDA